MLDAAARSALAERFSVYDHEWRYLSCHVGEPSLVDDLLVFDDGAVLSLCAFDISESGRTVLVDRLRHALSVVHEAARHRLVHVWGCFEVTEALDLGPRTYALTDQDASGDEYPGEFTVDLLDETPEVCALRRKTLRKLDRCVNLMSFSRRIPGKRIDDAGLMASLDYARALGCHTFHLGYAGSVSLASFKRKWGARETGPRYKDAIYAADADWKALADAYGFAWMSRLTAQSDGA